MNSLEKEILLLSHENFLKTFNSTFVLNCNVINAETVINYRKAFSNLESNGYVKLHFDNSSKIVDALSLLSYEYEITSSGIEAICREKQV